METIRELPGAVMDELAKAAEENHAVLMADLAATHRSHEVAEAARHKEALEESEAEAQATVQSLGWCR